MRWLSCMLLASVVLAQEPPLSDAEKKMAARDFAGALAAYDKAIEAAPTDARAHAGRAVALQALGRFDEALTAVSKAIEVAPQPDARHYYLRGRIDLARRDLAAAIADFTKAIEIDPQQGGLFVERARVLERRRDYQGALADYAKGYELNGRDINALDGRGRMKEALRDYKGALEDYTLLTYAVPNSPAPFTMRGDLKLSQGDYKGAIDDFDAAIYNAPKDGRAYIGRARAKLALGEKEEADADAAKAAGEGADANSFAYRGRYYLDTGRSKEAAADFAKAVEMAPKLQDYTRLFLFLARARNGEREAAAAELKAYADGRQEKGDWYGNVASFLTGQMKEDAFLAAAKSESENRTREQECEASWYAAAARLLDGDTAGAKALLERCVATEVRNFIEYESARMALEAMAK